MSDTVDQFLGSLGNDQRTAIARALEAAAETPTYVHPWAGLEDDLERRGQAGIATLGYGSLVNVRSAGLTLSSGTLSTARPAVAFGIRRLFNYRMPTTVPRYGPPDRSDARAALNVRHTGRPGDVVNGLLIDVARDDIGPMRAREQGYDLVPVVAIDWRTPHAPPFPVFVLQATAEPRDGVRYTDNSLTPHLEYYRQCWQGARDFGEDFLALWRDSTYLADGQTRVTDWKVGRFKRPD